VTAFALRLFIAFSVYLFLVEQPAPSGAPMPWSSEM